MDAVGPFSLIFRDFPCVAFDILRMAGGGVNVILSSQVDRLS